VIRTPSRDFFVGLRSLFQVSLAFHDSAPPFRTGNNKDGTVFYVGQISKQA
jgi:hypothetical protein